MFRKIILDIEFCTDVRSNFLKLEKKKKKNKNKNFNFKIEKKTKKMFLKIYNIVSQFFSKNNLFIK